MYGQVRSREKREEKKKDYMIYHIFRRILTTRILYLGTPFGGDIGTIVCKNYSKKMLCILIIIYLIYMEIPYAGTLPFGPPKACDSHHMG